MFYWHMAARSSRSLIAVVFFVMMLTDSFHGLLRVYDLSGSIFQILVQEPVFIVPGLSRTYVVTYTACRCRPGLSLTVIYEMFKVDDAAVCRTGRIRGEKALL